MIINKGLWTSITLDGIEASISQTCVKSLAFLTLFGPEREAGNPWSAYTIFGGLPKDDDNSAFAVLYRKLDKIAKEIGLDGPHGENHPAVFRRFEYFHTETPEKLLGMLADCGIVIKITKIDHGGNDAEVEAVKKAFGRWITADTVLKPNPKIEEERKHAEWRANFNKEYEEMRRKDKIFEKRVLLPILFVVNVAIIWWTFPHHWITGGSIVFFIDFAYWWVRH